MRTRWRRFFRKANRLQARLAVVVWLAIAAILGADAISLWATRAQIIATAQADTSNLARSLADQTRSVFQALDLVLLDAREHVETHGMGPESLHDVAQVLGIRIQALRPIHRVLIADAAGRVRATSQGEVAGQQDIAATSLFAHHRSNPDRGFFLGAPMRDQADGSWVLTISRRLDTADGKFGGVVAATLPCEAFTQAYAGFSTGPHGIILLARNDGVLLARWPIRDDDFGRDLSHGVFFSQIVGLGDRPIFEFVSQVDGLAHLGSYHRVRDLPLLVMVGTGRADVLAEWRRMVLVHLLGLSVIVTVILFLAGSLSRRIDAAEQNRLALRDSLARLAQSEAQMARANRWLEMAEELAQVGHWVLRLQGGPALSWSDEVFRIYGVNKEGFVPELDRALAAYHPQDRPALSAAIDRARSLGEPYELTLRLIGADGTIRHVLTRGVPQLGQDGQVMEIFGVILDVTTQKRNEAALLAANEAAEDANLSLAQANRSLQALAMQDSLTCLSNRRHFDLALDSEFRRAMRARTSLALILIDVDQFKPFNDTYGHPAGDACLRAIAGILPGFLHRPGDMAARYGGEELAVLLPGSTEAGARDLAERIADAVRDLGLVHAGSQHGIVTISAGVQAFVPVHHQDVAAELVAHADLALYAAKHAGRDRVFAYSDLGNGDRGLLPASIPPADTPSGLA